MQFDEVSTGSVMIDRMDWLRRLFGRGANGPSASELAVLGQLLGSEDPRLRKVRDQLVRAPEILRERPSVDSYRVGPTSTFDDLSFSLEVDRLASGWLSVRDARSGRQLQFRVVLGRHGFLRGLEGRTADGGPWPADWSVTEDDLAGQPAGLLNLPPLQQALEFEERARRRLSEWLAVPVGGRIEVAPPRSQAAVAARERELGGAFPGAYRHFLAITDGLTAAGVTIYGLRDVRRAGDPSMPGVLVAWDADDHEEFAVVLPFEQADLSVYRIALAGAGKSPRALASSFEDYLRGYLTA